MSPEQRARFFMPAWTLCCQRNRWFTREGFAVVEEQLLPAEGRQAIAFARQRARMRDGARAPQPFTLRDLHHGCYLVALGRDKDTERLTNKEQDRIVALVRYLAAPMDLKAIATWQAYQRGEDPGQQVRTKHFIRSRGPEAILRHLTHDLTGGQTKDWESLDEKKQAELSRLLAQRPVYGHSPKLEGRGQKAEVRKPNPKQYVLNPHKKFGSGLL